MSNLALNYTLRNSTDPDVHKPQRKMLTLEYVRNKDGMAIELIVRLTRPELVEVLNKVSLVVTYTCAGELQPILPSFCYLPGTSWHCFGARFNKNFTHPCSRLLTIRLHWPTRRSTELSKDIKDSIYLCFSKGMAFLTERGILRHALDITTSKEKCLISNTKHLVLFRMLQTYIVSRWHCV